MLETHRRFLWVDQTLAPIIVNFFLNGGIAWLMFRGAEAVPLWGRQSIGGDTLGTTFFLPFFTCLIVTPLVRRQVASGRIARSGWRRSGHALLGRLPAGSLARAAVLGGISLVVVAPAALAGLAALGISELGLGPFLWLKALYASALAALVTPVIGVCALSDASAAAAPSTPSPVRSRAA